jgi:hypothetical protein
MKNQAAALTALSCFMPSDGAHRNIITVVRFDNYPDNQMEKNEMGGACSMYGGKERCIQDFGGET